MDPLKTDWSPQYAQTKFKAYLAYYVLFFTVLLLLLMAVDKSNWFQATVERLLDNARASEVYMKQMRLAVALAANRDAEATPKLAIIDPKGKVFQSMQALHTADNDSQDAAAAAADELESATTTMTAPAFTTTQVLAMHNLAVGGTSVDLKFFNYKEKDRKNSKEFLAYLLSGRCLLGCSDMYFKGGLRAPLLYRFFPALCLAPGRAEDFLLYLCNNHSVLSCCFSAKGSRYSRTFRRLSLVSQHALSFFFQNMVIVICTSVGIGSTYDQATSDPGKNVLLNVIVDIGFCAPLSLFIAEAIKWIYLFQIPIDKAKNRRYLYAASKNVGIILSVVLTMTVICTLIVLSLMTAGKGIGSNIFQYIQQVLLVSIVLDVIYSAMLFECRYSYGLYLFNYRINIVSIGQLYLEQLLYSDAKLDEDYAEMRTSLFFGIINIDRVLSMEELCRINAASLRRKLLWSRICDCLSLSGRFPRARKGADVSRKSANVEMGSLFNRQDNSIYMTDNPLLTDLRPSGGFQYGHAFENGRSSNGGPLVYTQNPLVTRAQEEAARPSNFSFAEVLGDNQRSLAGTQHETVTQYFVNPLANRANAAPIAHSSIASAASDVEDDVYEVGGVVLNDFKNLGNGTSDDDTSSSEEASPGTRALTPNPHPMSLDRSAAVEMRYAGDGLLHRAGLIDTQYSAHVHDQYDSDDDNHGVDDSDDDIHGEDDSDDDVDDDDDPADHGRALRYVGLSKKHASDAAAVVLPTPATLQLRPGKRRASFFNKVLYYEQRIAEVAATARPQRPLPLPAADSGDAALGR